uniref:Uncharacterized protein n=1 Tax=Ixodes ricinus TaxID=34613 RepID=V5H2N4_IXORI
MVELTGGGPEGPIEHGFNNWVFIVPAVITVTLISFFTYKLVQSLRDKREAQGGDEEARSSRRRSPSDCSSHTTCPSKPPLASPPLARPGISTHPDGTPP